MEFVGEEESDGTYGAEREVEKDDGVACATRSICGRGRVGAAVLSRAVAVVPVCGIVVVSSRGVRFCGDRCLGGDMSPG